MIFSGRNSLSVSEIEFVIRWTSKTSKSEVRGESNHLDDLRSVWIQQILSQEAGLSWP